MTDKKTKQFIVKKAFDKFYQVIENNKFSYSVLRNLYGK